MSEASINDILESKDLPKLFALVWEAIHANIQEIAEPVYLFQFLYEMDREVSKSGFNRYFFDTQCASVDGVKIAVQAICGEPQTPIFLQAKDRMLANLDVHFKIRDAIEAGTDLEAAYAAHANDIDFQSLDQQWRALSDDTHAKLLQYIESHKFDFASLPI